MTLQRIAVLAAAVIVVAAGCDDSGQETTSLDTEAPTSSTTSTISPSTSTSTTTTASTTTTTTAPSTTTTTSTSTTTTTVPTTTTTADPPPGAVGGLTVAIGGGSGEVIPEWNRGSETDLSLYRIWYSDDPGASKTLLAEIPHDTASLPAPAYNAGGGRTAYVDLRAQEEGKHCYEISAVDTGGSEGSRSDEVCLPTTPPATPSGFTVGTGGGSGEVMIYWTRVPDPDAVAYRLWFSELPGGAISLLNTIAHEPSSISGPAYDMGGGQTAYIDFPRAIENGVNCYQVSAVDTAGNESPRTGEACLSGL